MTRGCHCEERSDAAIHVFWLSLRAQRGNPCRHEAMDRHGLRPRDDEVGEWPREDERLSLRAQRGNPCRHEAMDRHGLRPRDDEVGKRPRDDYLRQRGQLGFS